MRLTRRALLRLIALPVFAVPALGSWPAAGEVLVPDSWRVRHPGPYTVDLRVLLDDEAASILAPDPSAALAGIIASASDDLGPAGVTLRIVASGTWPAPPVSEPIQALFPLVRSVVPGTKADVVAAFAGRVAGDAAGISSADHRHLLVADHPYRPDIDSLIVAHEFGHLFGLDHHPCPDEVCLMSTHTYDQHPHFCDEHLCLLKKNGGLFQYLGRA